MKCRSFVPLGMTIAMASAGAQTTDVALGIEALARRDVKGADAAFARGTTSPNQALRATAWQWRGHIAWKLRGDHAAASRHLDSALANARDSSQVLLEIARLNGARHRHRDAVRVAVDAMSRSLDAERRGAAARTLVELAVDAAFKSLPTSLADSVDLQRLGIVRDTMRSRVARFPGRTIDARALIDAAAMLGDSTGVRTGLSSYFALDRRQGSPGTESVADRLRAARMHEALALYLRATDPRPADALLRNVFVYADILRDVRAATERIYRAELAGATRAGEINRAIVAIAKSHWRQIQLGDSVPAFYPALFTRMIAQRFGARISIERSRGYDELYFGHSVHLETSGGGAVTETLDGMIASGIDDWLLDGAGGRAGWVAGDTVYERRTALTETPFRALLGLTDPQTIPGELFRMTRDSVGDIERAKRDSLGYFPGMAARLFRAGASALLDSVKAPDAFTRALYQSLVKSAIELHEGRHRADLRSGRATNPADDEFRAKIDEVTGAPLPRLALTAILSPNIGDGSPHGQANRRIMIGLNRWIRRNGAAITGYDRATPALLQLPNLTDAQLRAAFESMRRP